MAKVNMLALIGGAVGVSALGLYVWKKTKAAKEPAKDTGAKTPAKSDQADTSVPKTGPVPGSMSLDWRQFGYDLGFAQGAKDKMANLSAASPEPPESELAKAGVDPVALRAGYAEGYKAGQASVIYSAVKGTWKDGAYLPDYWKSIPVSK